MNTNEFIGPLQQDVPHHMALFALLPWVLLGLLALFGLWLLPVIQKYALTIKPVVIDGLIITFLSAFIFSQMFFGSEECYKYVNVFILFWLKYTFGMGAATLTGLKAFRSTEYANHLQGQKDIANGKTTVTEIHETTDSHETKISPPNPTAGNVLTGS